MPRQKKTTTKSPKSQIAKAVKRPKYKKVTAISIRLPESEVEEGETPKFFINYVLNSGKLVTKPCTHKIWKDVTAEELFRKFRYQFEIFEDSDSGEVQHIDAKLKKEHLPSGFSEDDLISVGDDDSVKEPRFVEVVINPDNEVSVKRAPTKCTKATEDEILESISNDTSIKSGDYLKGAYRVDEIREREGYKTLYVDAEFKA